MRINAQLVVTLRRRKSWSQEELAIASGLNLRTTQRIEADGVASLQSRKALASAFDMEIDELDIPETPVMKTYEYKMMTFKLQGLMRKMPDISGLLNKEGEKGWRLKELVVPDATGSMGQPWALLERETTG